MRRRTLAIAASVVTQLGVDVGGEVARGDGVHLGAEACPLGGDGAREVDDRALGRAVGREPRSAEEAEHRGDVDRAAGSRLGEPSAGLAAAQEHAAHVGVEDAVPLGLVEVDEVDVRRDAGVVDEDVDAAEL